MNSNTPAATAHLIAESSTLRPTLAIVLGSGFHGLGTRVELAKRLHYSELPGFPSPSVPGHSGELLLGKLGSVAVAVLSGRAHYYEGHEMSTVTFAVRTLAALGVTDLLLTNAAGGINPDFNAGDLMLITDHINFMGMNPLRGVAAPGVNRFVDLTQAYDPKLSKLLTQAADESGLQLKSGVYLAVSGPSYETPAEVRAFGKLGADAVGMSTVPEVLAARQLGLRVAGLSCITNAAAGISRQPLSHTEVLETAERVKPMATNLLCNFAELYGKARF